MNALEMRAAEMKAAPANPYGPSPIRRPASIRRTSTIETEWPEGMGKPMRMHGRARDLFTPRHGSTPRVLVEDTMEILASPTREIMTIETCRGDAAAQQLVGSRGGGYLRGEIARVLPEEHAQGTPLHLLLDDFSGGSLVAGWAWSRWTAEWARRITDNRPTGPGSPGRNGRMEGICYGFRPGSSALNPDGTSNPHIQSATRVPSLLRDDDPIGWHQLAEQEGVGSRRARRLDVWFEDEVIQIDVGFQDSATAPDGGWRVAVHEYQLSATADPETFELLSMQVDPRVLPYGECPGASPNARRMVGTRLDSFRHEVLEHLSGTAGCTHLNDVLRSMSDVPQLARRLLQELHEPAA